MNQVLSAVAAGLFLSAAALTPVLSADDATDHGVAGEETTKATDTTAETNAMTEESDAGAVTDKGTMADVPSDAMTVAVYYRETVYDDHDNKIGGVNDLLLDAHGRVQAVIVGVGGFLGVGEKDVAVPFDALKVAERNGDFYLVLSTSRQALEEAPGYIYDESKRNWIPTKKPG